MNRRGFMATLVAATVALFVRPRRKPPKYTRTIVGVDYSSNGDCAGVCLLGKRDDGKWVILDCKTIVTAPDAARGGGKA